MRIDRERNHRQDNESPQAWDVITVTTPEELLGAAELFDAEVTIEGASDALARHGQHFLLAVTRTGQAIGFVSGVEMRHPDKDAEMFVNELGVSPSWRRQGVARSLLSALGDHARSRGCTGLWTATEPDNDAALATYRSLGAEAEQTAVMIDIELHPRTD